jgi:hypothetical protein
MMYEKKFIFKNCYRLQYNINRFYLVKESCYQQLETFSTQQNSFYCILFSNVILTIKFFIMKLLKHKVRLFCMAIKIIIIIKNDI